MGPGKHAESGQSEVDEEERVFEEGDEEVVARFREALQSSVDVPTDLSPEGGPRGGCPGSASPGYGHSLPPIGQPDRGLQSAVPRGDDGWRAFRPTSEPGGNGNGDVTDARCEAGTRREVGAGTRVEPVSSPPSPRSSDRSRGWVGAWSDQPTWHQLVEKALSVRPEWGPETADDEVDEPDDETRRIWR